MEILTNNQKHDIIMDNASSVANSFQVTDIKQAVKNPNRANIFIDGKYSFSLDITQLVDAKLKIGAQLTAERLDELKHASAFGKLYQRTLEWVLARPRSVKETKDYLSRKTKENLKSSFEECKTWPSGPERLEKESFQVLDMLINKGYLDDRKFAEYYIENRFVKKGISTKRLKMELTKKGVSQQIITEVIGQTSRTDEQEIQKIIAKKRAKYDDDKLIQYLARQGFDFELARNLVRASSGTD